MPADVGRATAKACCFSNSHHKRVPQSRDAATFRMEPSFNWKKKPYLHSRI